MPRNPEIYTGIIGTIKIGAIVGPLFEAFMEGAVLDRLADAEAVAIVTTSALKQRIPRDKLPHLKYVIVVDEQEQWLPGEIDYRQEMAEASDELDIAWLILNIPSYCTIHPDRRASPKACSTFTEP